MTAINSKTLTTNEPSFLLAHSRLDIFPVMMGCAHLGFQILLFTFFRQLPWFALIPLGFLYSYCIAWNIESVAHNFTHNQYFKSHALNRACSASPSRLPSAFRSSSTAPCTAATTLAIPTGRMHRVSHKDWFSIYLHGKDGKPGKSIWTYALTGFFRGDGDADI